MFGRTFHMTDDGPRICKAKIKDCPLGGGTHYSDKKEAQEIYENLNNTLQVRMDRLDYTIDLIQRKEKEHRALVESVTNTYNSELKPITINHIANLESVIRGLRNEERNYFYDVKLAEIDAFEKGALKEVPKENIFQSRGAKWSNHLGVGYGGDINANLNDEKKLTAKRMESLSTEYAAWAGVDLPHARRVMDELKDDSKKYNKSLNELVTAEFQSTANNTQDKARVFVDLETSSLDAFRGEIIEIGIVRVNPDGTVEKFSDRFDLERAEVRDIYGTGAVDVHKIYPKDIAGRLPFTHYEIQGKYSEILNDPDSITIAHNAGFEHAFLSTHLKDYHSTHISDSADSLRARPDHHTGLGVPAVYTQDTRALASYLMESKDNKLETFSTMNGVSAQEYSDTAHGALADADMTQRAFHEFQLNLKARPRGKKYAGEDRTK